MLEKDIVDGYLFSSILQVSLAFPNNSHILSSKMLQDAIIGIEKDRIKTKFFGEFISKESVVQKFEKATVDSIMKYMKDVAVNWISCHPDWENSVPYYYKHCIGKTAKGDYYFIISQKEYIFCTIHSSNISLSSKQPKLCSVKSSSNPQHISLSLSRSHKEPIQNTLLILFDSIPEQFSVVSHNWIHLQQLVEKLFLDYSSANDLFSNALVQRLLQIYIRDGILVPRYYNIHRKEPGDDRYWKFNPFYIDKSIQTLQSLLRAICKHLISEESSFLFREPVSSEQVPDYRLVIPYPMDLHTVLKRINNRFYTTYSAFHRDILQIFRNGCTYNPCRNIWYQQCVVLKLCYLTIYEGLKVNGIVDSLPEEDQLSEDSIISCMKEGTSLQFFTSASSCHCKVISHSRKAIEDFTKKNVEGSFPSTALLKYPVRRATSQYTATNEDEISLKEKEIVYLINSTDSEEMVEVMKMDLNEMGFFPKQYLEEVEQDQVLKRVREDKDIKEVRVIKRGKLIDVQSSDDPTTLQTMLSNYHL